MEGAYLVSTFASETGTSIILPLLHVNEDYKAKVAYMWKEQTRVYYKFNIYDLSGYSRDAPIFLSILYNFSDRNVSFDPEYAQTIIKAAKAKQALNSKRGDKRLHEENDAGDRSRKRKKKDGEGQLDNGRAATSEAGKSSLIRLGKLVYRKGNIVTKEVQGLDLQWGFRQCSPPALIVLADACNAIQNHSFYDKVNELDEAFLSHMLPISQGLARGLNFLHTTLSVAHRDIKPRNLLLVPGSFTLVITDFDVAVKNQVQVRGMVGTIGYMAPVLYSCFACFPYELSNSIEVESKGPYNPFLADRFSCGKVFEYIWLYSVFFPSRLHPTGLRQLKDFSQLLQDNNPLARPELSEWLPKESREVRSLDLPQAVSPTSTSNTGYQTILQELQARP
ncbi:kinase-like domain-containing protein [Rhodocollybia butyracea]|uniref:Kinase-like domain-containing protein n=1 Tax=Rhodocollybia butyracea TaxID=206335 RepID=A0A9P5PPH9_9AGAR|nr:kinase-like domain-containing protein [Rhodocollybia butyracea]